MTRSTSPLPIGRQGSRAIVLGPKAKNLARSTSPLPIGKQGLRAIVLGNPMPDKVNESSADREARLQCARSCARS
eukprot:213486-Hanusia_phi.AAC.1